MAYSFRQLEGLWEQAGGNHAIAPVMAAIALAESGGNPNATGGVGEKGLWQINPHAWGSLATYDPLGNAKAAVHVLSVQGLTAWSTYNSGAYKHFVQSGSPLPPTGTGQAPGTTTAAGRGSGGNATAGSVNASVGKAVEAITDIGQTSTGSWVTDFENAIKALDPLASVPAAITGLALPFAKFAQGLDWFFTPSHWIRILAGVAGGGMVLSGVGVLALGGQEKPISLPLGIGLVGFGAVLLVVAFHNLDPSIKTVGELAADLQSKIQSPGSTSPAAAVSAAGG